MQKSSLIKLNRDRVSYDYYQKKENADQRRVRNRSKMKF